MTVFILMVKWHDDPEDIAGVYSTLDMAIDAGDEYEEKESYSVAIKQWDVIEPERDPQRMMVIYEDWGPSLPPAMRTN